MVCLEFCMVTSAIQLAGNMTHSTNTLELFQHYWAHTSCAVSVFQSKKLETTATVHISNNTNNRCKVCCVLFICTLYGWLLMSLATLYNTYVFHMNGHIIKWLPFVCSFHEWFPCRNDGFLCTFSFFVTPRVCLYSVTQFWVASKKEECRLPFDVYRGPPQQSQWPFIWSLTNSKLKDTGSCLQ